MDFKLHHYRPLPAMDGKSIRAIAMFHGDSTNHTF
jgi:hypothetical protein